MTNIHSYTREKYGILYATNKQFGSPDDPDKKLDMNYVNQKLQFNDLNSLTVNVGTVKFGSLTTQYERNSTYNFNIVIGDNTDTYLYVRTFAIMKNKTTGELVASYSEPVAVTYNKIKALEDAE